MISNAEEFRNLVRIIAEDEPNPHKVTSILVGKLSGFPEAMSIALTATAPQWVAGVVKRPHMAPPTPPEAGGNGFGPTFSSGDTRPPRIVTDAEGNRRASTRQAGLVDWYTARLSVSVKFGPSSNDWKRLRDCTADDLRWMIQERLDQAAQNSAVAERYERLLAAMSEAAAGVVGDLDTATGRTILLD